MLKKRRINQRLLQDRQPMLREKQNISTVTFCKELELFCDGYLKGAVNLYTRQINAGVLSVSLEYFAYFLKLLLEAIAGIGAVDMYVDMREVAAVTLKFDSTIIDDDIVRRMFKIAIRAGFVCARNEEVILLEVAIHKDRCVTVSANNSLHFYRVLREIVLKSENSPIPNIADKI